MKHTTKNTKSTKRIPVTKRVRTNRQGGSGRKAVIVCGGSVGRAVVYGYVDAMPRADTAVTIYDARMILEWTGTHGLFGLAQHGPQKGSRITCAVPVVTDTCRQCLTVSAAAEEAINGWPDA